MQYAFINHQKKHTLMRSGPNEWDWVFLSLQTYIGALLISVNPYKELDIYNKKQMDIYMGVNFFELPPHMLVSFSLVYIYFHNVIIQMYYNVIKYNFPLLFLYEKVYKMSKCQLI